MKQKSKRLLGLLLALALIVGMVPAITPRAKAATNLDNGFEGMDRTFSLPMASIPLSFRRALIPILRTTPTEEKRYRAIKSLSLQWPPPGAARFTAKATTR